jgi:hypothetical protein
VRTGLDTDPFPPPGFTNFSFVGRGVSYAVKTEGELLIAVGVDDDDDDVRLLSGQSFVHVANSLQYVGLGP